MMKEYTIYLANEQDDDTEFAVEMVQQELMATDRMYHTFHPVLTVTDDVATITVEFDETDERTAEYDGWFTQLVKEFNAEFADVRK